jgi:hypothetical protein
VTLGEDGRLRCSDGYFECNGNLCRHCAHVAYKHGDATFNGFTHHDISVRWWKSYSYFCTKEKKSCCEKEITIQANLHALYDNDCEGPSFVESHPPGDGDYPVCKFGDASIIGFQELVDGPAGFFQQMTAAESVLNYSEDVVNKALDKTTKSSVAVSMTQELIHGDNSDLDDEYGDDFSFGTQFKNELRQMEPTRHASPYDMLMPLAKELIAVTSNRNESSWAGVAQILKDAILHGKADLASGKPPPKGSTISICQKGKNKKKTKISSKASYN